MSGIASIVDGGLLKISIDMGLLKHVVEHHPAAFDGERDTWRVTDIHAFARAVCKELLRDQSEQVGLLQSAVDAAIERAVESACDGVEFVT